MNTQEAFKKGWNCRAGGATHRNGHVIYRENGKWWLQKMKQQGDSLVKEQTIKLTVATLGEALDAATRKI